MGRIFGDAQRQEGHHLVRREPPRVDCSFLLHRCQVLLVLIVHRHGLPKLEHSEALVGVLLIAFTGLLIGMNI